MTLLGHFSPVVETQLKYINENIQSAKSIRTE